MQFIAILTAVLLTARCASADACAKGTAFPCERFMVQHSDGKRYWAFDAFRNGISLSSERPLVFKTQRSLGNLNGDDFYYALAVSNTQYLASDDASHLTFSQISLNFWRVSIDNEGVVAIILPRDGTNETTCAIESVDSIGLTLCNRPLYQWRLIECTADPCQPNGAPLQLNILVQSFLINGDKLRVFNGVILFRRGTDLLMVRRDALIKTTIPMGILQLKTDFDFEIIQDQVGDPLIILISKSFYRIFRPVLSNEVLTTITGTNLNGLIATINVYHMQYSRNVFATRYDISGSKLFIDFSRNSMAISSKDMTAFLKNTDLLDPQFAITSPIFQNAAAVAWSLMNVAMSVLDNVVFTTLDFMPLDAIPGQSQSVFYMPPGFWILLFGSQMNVYDNDSNEIRVVDFSVYGLSLLSAANGIFLNQQVCFLGRFSATAHPTQANVHLCCFDPIYAFPTQEGCREFITEVTNAFSTGDEIFLISESDFYIIKWAQPGVNSSRFSFEKYGSWSIKNNSLIASRIQQASAFPKTTATNAPQDPPTSTSPFIMLIIISIIGIVLIVITLFSTIWFIRRSKRRMVSRNGKLKERNEMTSMSSMMQLTSTQMSRKTGLSVAASATASAHTMGNLNLGLTVGLGVPGFLRFEAGLDFVIKTQIAKGAFGFISTCTVVSPHLSEAAFGESLIVAKQNFQGTSKTQLTPCR